MNKILDKTISGQYYIKRISFLLFSQFAPENCGGEKGLKVPSLFLWVNLY